MLVPLLQPRHCQQAGLSFPGRQVQVQEHRWTRGSPDTASHPLLCPPWLPSKAGSGFQSAWLPRETYRAQLHVAVSCSLLGLSSPGRHWIWALKPSQMLTERSYQSAAAGSCPLTVITEAAQGLRRPH